MTSFYSDARFALRLLRKSPALCLAVATLALGIGATTGVYSLVDALLLRPLPAVQAPEELVAVLGVHTRQPEGSYRISWANYLDYASHTEVFSGLAATADCDLSLTQGGPAERVSALAVSPNYFSVLGLQPALGRHFLPGEERTPIAVLGHGLWRRRFGADPRVLGSTLVLNGKRVTVIGVAPEGFWGTDLQARREIWLPLGVYSEIAKGVFVAFSGQHDRKQEWLGVLGRLDPGVSHAQAQAAIDVIAGHLEASYPEVNTGRGARVLPLTELALGQGMRPLILRFTVRLMAAMILVLGVAVINLAGLLLAQALARRREIAMRLSLGSSRLRLVRQLFGEGMTLGLFGAVAGLALAQAGLPLLEKLHLPAELAVRELRLSGRVVGVTFLVALVSTLLFSLAPALQALRTEPLAGLRGEVPRRRFSFGLREALVGIQVALTLIILIGAGLMLRTLANLGAIDPGFDPARVLVLSIDLAPSGYQGPRVAAFYEELLERLRRLPGIEEASMASALPVMGGDLQVDLTVTLDDASTTGTASSPGVRHVLVGSRYFQTVGMKLLRGRGFGPEDAVSSMGAVVVNESAARLLWPRADPLGHRLRLIESETPFEVVGIVADATYASLKEEAVPVIYLAHSQYEKSFIGSLLAPQMTLLLRAAEDPRKELRIVREMVHSMDPLLPVFRVSTLEELLAATVGLERQAAAIYSFLAVLAMILAMLGLYAAFSHAVVVRTREIGVRMACGAGPAQVQNLVLQRSALLTLSGMAAGMMAAIPFSRLLKSQIYGIEPGDLFTWLFAVFGLVGAALLVSWLPARRAARLDPVAAIGATTRALSP